MLRILVAESPSELNSRQRNCGYVAHVATHATLPAPLDSSSPEQSNGVYMKARVHQKVATNLFHPIRPSISFTWTDRQTEPFQPDRQETYSRQQTVKRCSKTARQWSLRRRSFSGRQTGRPTIEPFRLSRPTNSDPFHLRRQTRDH